jgi:hypothetical protein
VFILGISKKEKGLYIYRNRDVLIYIIENLKKINSKKSIKLFLNFVNDNFVVLFGGFLFQQKSPLRGRGTMCIMAIRR